MKTIKAQQIKQMDQIEHCLKKPSMYIGSVANEEQEEFMLNDEHTLFELKTRSYIPGLIKIFNEIIDNSIDEYVRTGGKRANKITVKMDNKTFECSDNGRGIPNTKMTTLKGESKYQAEVAFTEMLSGANYENDDEATIGTNGLGSKAASIFSKKSVIKNDDGNELVTITTKNNLSDVEVQSEASKSPGVFTKIYPDLDYFGLGLVGLDEVIHNVIKERLLHLSISYPGITFKFNAKTLRLKTKDYFGMFDAKEFIDLNDNVSIAVTHSPSDQFEHFSLVNGLVTKSGGTHINLLSNEIINPLRTKLVKKFKTIKPGDIKQKLRVIVIFRDFKNTRYTSQTKEQVTNSVQEVKEYLGDYNKDLDKFTQKILKNDDIMLPITELFLLKEQAKQNADLKKLSKTTKRIKSEKYLPSTGVKKYLMLVEGESALGGLMPVLGRKEIGYFSLKGKPLNAYSSDQKKFTQNKELSELFQVIQNEGYQYIITATDQDLDGLHIRGLLLGFFQRYLPEMKTRVGIINTPVIGVKKGKALQRWYYNLNDEPVIKSGETSKYYKGLGSWKESDLKYVVQQDGLAKMIELFEFDDDEVIDDWLGDGKSDKRKEYIQENEFSIAKL